MIQDDKFYIIGIDGGASKTQGILFIETGQTLSSTREGGSNLTLDAKTSVDRIQQIINNLCIEAKIPIDHVDAIGLGIAGASDENGRDLLFGKMDSMNLSQRTIIMNDAEAAYNLGCPGDFGILVTVGTGVICIAKNSEGDTVREAGRGHEQGDMGSGYWIGKQAILNLSLNETSVIGDCDLEEIMTIFLAHVNEKDFQIAIEKLNRHKDSVFIIAGIAKSIIGLAERGNEIALSIVQEATHALAEYILTLADKLSYNEDNIVLAGNGSVIRNDFFRKLLNEELRFNFSQITWTFSSVSSAYGAGILAAQVYDVSVSVSDILKGDLFVST